MTDYAPRLKLLLEEDERRFESDLGVKESWARDMFYKRQKMVFDQFNLGIRSLNNDQLPDPIVIHPFSETEETSVEKSAWMKKVDHYVIRGLFAEAKGIGITFSKERSNGGNIYIYQPL